MTGITLDRQLYRVGSVIAGRYEVLSQLGSGGIGVVLRVSDRELRGKELALKLLHPHLLGNERLAARLRNEVLLMRELTHPNIVRLFEFGDAGEQRFFITMEYVRGQSLRQYLKSLQPDRLPFDEVLRIMEQICSGVAHAHERGILHRDLKPDNILLGEKGELKIADFGLARRLEDHQDLTRTGETVGTVYYMAPEQIRAEPLDARADVYSLGIIAFELALGARPFEDNSYFTVIHRQLTEDVPDLTRQDTSIPAWFRDLVQRATTKERRARHANAGELGRELRENAFDRSVRARRIIRLSFRQRRRLRKYLTRTSVILPTLLAILCAISAMNKKVMYVVSRPVVALEYSTGAKLGWVKSLLGSDIGMSDEQVLGYVTSSPGDIKALATVLAAGKTPDIRDEDGDTLLAIAATYDPIFDSRAEAIFSLLEHGANPNVKSVLLERPPLIWTILARNVSGSLALLGHGAEADSVDALGGSPLLYAANTSMTGIAIALLDRGADPNQADTYGWTPLTHAVSRQNLELVHELLRRKADPKKQAIDGTSPLELAFYLELGDYYDDMLHYRERCIDPPELGIAQILRRLSELLAPASSASPWAAAEQELFINLPSASILIDCYADGPIHALAFAPWYPITMSLVRYGATPPSSSSLLGDDNLSRLRTAIETIKLTPPSFEPLSRSADLKPVS